MGGRGQALRRQARVNARGSAFSEDMDLQNWIGRSEIARDTISAAPYAALSATLDGSPEKPALGVQLPALWHWLYFLPIYRRSELGPDGLPRGGTFLPPIPLPRRMWAGFEVSCNEPLRIGDIVARTSTIDEISEKRGRSGRLVFVRVRHEIRREETPRVLRAEVHTVVFRDAPVAADGPPAAARPQDLSTRPAWEEQVVPDDVLLFRYSAMMFNAHRIHYDRRYATTVEGYAGLVIHGPLVAVLLLDLLGRRVPGAEVARCEFRALQPLFDNGPFSICGAPRDEDNTYQLWARDQSGSLVMECLAVVR